MHVTAFPYLAGIGCSLCYGGATILELLAARRQEKIDSLHIKHLAGLLKQKYYLLGVILDFTGWILFLLTSKSLPLFLTMSFVVLSLGVTAVLAASLLSIKTSRTSELAIGIIMAGIVGLGFAAQPSHAYLSGATFKLVLELATLPTIIAGTILLKGKTKAYTSGLIAMLSGLAFGVTGLIARVIHISHLDAHSILQLMVLALIVYGIIGAVLMAAALQRDAINRVNCILFTTELVVPSLIGLIFLSDRPRQGYWPLTIISLVFIVAATIVVTLDSKVEESKVD